MSKTKYQRIILRQLSVYNWGVFSGLHHAYFEPSGTMIVGTNGSGKTSILDSYFTLHLSNPIYNVAVQDDEIKKRKENRDLISYLRGVSGTRINEETQQEEIICNRSGDFISAIFATYETDTGDNIIIGKVFWVADYIQKGNDCDCLMFIANHTVDFTALLNDVNRKYDLRALKTVLQQHYNVKDIYSKTDKNKFYLHVNDKLEITNDKTFELLNKAAGMKQISNLNELFQTFVLEESNSIGKIQELSQYIDLSFQTIEQYANYKKQYELLTLIQNNYEKIKYLNIQQDKLNSLSVFVQQMFYIQTRDNLIAKLAVAQEQQAKFEQEKIDIELVIKNDEQLIAYKKEQSYANNMASMIQGQEATLNAKTHHLKTIEREQDKYISCLRVLGMDNLYQFNQNSFNNITTQLKLSKSDIDVSILEKETEFHELKSVERECNNQLISVKNELAEIVKLKSSIPLNLQRVRDLIVQSLNIDEDYLKFIGELIKVQDEETEWQGAIERALSGTKTTLLVPNIFAHEVTQFMNNNHLGVKLSVMTVDVDYIGSGIKRFDKSSYLSKLDWNEEYQYIEWLKNYLYIEKNWLCVNSIEELNKTEYSMTKEGLLHYKANSYTKDDRKNINDKSSWCLGFSNAARIEQLDKEKIELEQKLVVLKEQVKQINSDLFSIKNQADKICRAIEFNFSDIDTTLIKSEIVQLENSLFELKEKNKELVELQNEINALQVKVKESDKIRIGIIENIGKCKREIDSITKEIADIEKNEIYVSVISNEEINEQLNFAQQYNIDIKINELNHKQTLNKVLKSVEEVKNSVSENILQSFSVLRNAFEMFENHYPDMTYHWNKDGINKAQDITDVVDCLNKIKQDYSVASDMSFKQTFVNSICNSLTTYKNSHETQIDLIRDKISDINVVLRDINIVQNEIFEIALNKVNDSTMTRWNFFTNKINEIVEILIAFNNDSNELDKLFYLDHALKVIQEIKAECIDVCLDTVKKRQKDVLPLYDVRHFLNFKINVLDKNTNQVKKTISNSSKQSGGEAESFTGYMLAASLTYMLTNQNSNKPVFSTIFLDEALSRASDLVAQNTISVFQKFGLHLNMLTPDKIIRIGAQYLSGLNNVVKNHETFTSTISHFKWSKADLLSGKNDKLNKIINGAVLTKAEQANILNIDN